MATQNLPAKNNVAEIRTLLERSKKQFEMALPKHLPVDRLLRVAMTSIQRNSLLLKCTQTSLLSCIMTCAQLGLEPDQFLGQAYLIPFKNNQKGTYECQLIPGYRGYISLARRTGEVQTLSAQVVYENDEFSLQYGTEDKLEHHPALNGDRGKPVGAYCVIKYKDGGYSFDFMSTADIEKIRTRSKASGLKPESKKDVPWVTDWDEMAKKTVIRRHIKLAPLSIEFQTAAALEDRAMTGESQMDLIGSFGTDEDVIDMETGEDREALLIAFRESIPEGTDVNLLNKFLESVAKANKSDADGVKAEAAKQPEAFWKAFEQFQAKQTKAKPAAPEQEERYECPKGGYVTASICNKCKDLTDKSGERCPVAQVE